MKKISVLITICGTLFAANLAIAQSTMTFTNNSGWTYGDESNVGSLEGLDVSIEIKKNGMDNSMYVVGKFCNDGSETWRGGIRITLKPPTKAHAMLTVPSGECRKWGEHYPLGVSVIYVFADKSNQ